MNAGAHLTVIVGHRGTGKSAFLQRCLKNFPSHGPFFDLDFEIEKDQGRSVNDIFNSEKEDFFRKLEADIFQKLILTAKVIAVGAGFNLKNIPQDAKVIWVRRSSDLSGRIFLDRPRLLKEIDSLSEYELKRKDREPLFEARADLIYSLPEGIELSLTALGLEKILLDFWFKAESGLMLKKVGGIKTLFPADMKLKCLAVPNILELRDDLLSPEEMTSFLSADFNSEWMLSCRTKKLTVFKDVEKILSKINWVDQPVENKLTEDIFENKKIIFSSHQDNMLAGINELSGQTSAHLKLSPLVLHWEELWQGHQWQQMDPQNRSFLPRSIEGRWKWYRLYQKGRQELNFWYESQSSAPDQPSLVEWLLQPDKTTSFAAVLGSPVQQSLSPMMHLDFFKKQNCCFFAIDLQEDEWDEALPILQSLGLKAAAVTSPLKMRAFQSCLVKSDSAKDLKAVNTLAWDQKLKSWQGENTDFLGFTEFVKDQKKLSSCVIWGGYGVLSMLQKVLPESSAYSARLASPKEGNREIVSPSVVIWAAPTRVGIVYPPKYWEPEVVIDLNYAENSWGRQYALQSNARYISGLNFFRSQALHQQSFWHRLVDFAFSEDNH